MRSRILYHLFFWTGYLFFKSYLNFESRAYLGDGEKNFSFFILSAGAQLPLLAVKIPLVYTLFYLSDKFLSRQWKAAICISTAALSLFLGSLATVYISNNVILKYFFHLNVPASNQFSWSSILYSFFMLSFVCGIALAFKLVRSFLRQKEVEKEMMQKKMETELKFLKAQTNPHFLFNTLNNIYALARKKSDLTSSVVLQLSKLLRFMLYESRNSLVPLYAETQALEDYIALEKLRYNEKLLVSFSMSVDCDSQPIAPLILLPFVENAFKHGAGESRFASFININLSLKNSELHFTIENSIGQENSNAEQTEKAGLDNVSRLLELIYPDHQLDITKDNQVYRVSLKLLLQ
ncbi:MAG: histidine kinase [Chitinophagaceae bacterium]|nr:histidine kinase [Chitinophagaceae bacterium]